MLNWIKKRCRRKSAPSCGIHKFLSDSTHLESHHVYEEIDDVITPSSLAYAIVDIKEDMSRGISNKTDSYIACRECKNLKDRSSNICTCNESLTLSSQDYEEYEIPDTSIDPSASPIYENLPKPIKNPTKFPDFSRRPLPDIPQNVHSKCYKSMSKLSSFGELSYSDESSNSSGYFDSSYMTESDSSSDDSFINEFEMMAIKRKEMVCRKNRRGSNMHEAPKPEVAVKQSRLSTRESQTLTKHTPVNDYLKRNDNTEQSKVIKPLTQVFVCPKGQGQVIYPQSQTRRSRGHVAPEVVPRQQVTEISRGIMKPRMGCRALTNSNLTRSRSASRVNDPQFATIQCQSSFAVQRSLKSQRAVEVKSSNERQAICYPRSVSSPVLPIDRSPVSPNLLKTPSSNFDDGLYEDIF